jgi:DNA-binding transcriptional MerR regulator
VFVLPKSRAHPLSACAALMRRIFTATRGQNRLPQLNDSLSIYFNVAYEIQDRIQREYSKPTYERTKPGQYLLARGVVLKEVKGLLTAPEQKELEAFHNRRCRRWRKTMLLSEGDEDAEGDIDDELDEEEQAKLDEEKRKAVEREAREAAEDVADAPLENSVADVEAIIECVPTLH